jgi:hypothetical protein
MILPASDHESLAPAPPLTPTEHPAAASAPNRGPIGRAAYGFGYYLSFGVSFPFMMIASFIPAESTLGLGLSHGATDAIESSERVQAKAAAAVCAASDKVGGAYTRVRAGVAERIEAVQDKLAEKKYNRRIAAT